EEYPLRPADTSSPRATLGGFIKTTDDIYSRMRAVLQTYAESDRMHMTADERRGQQEALGEAPDAFRYLDFSKIPPVIMDTVPIERALLLKEVLDRIDIPKPADIPDQAAMAQLPMKRWRLPNTEIDIVQIESGPRAGEYLVSAETVARLPEFYRRVKDLPYKPGPGEQLASFYHDVSMGRSTTIYEAFLRSPLGLSFLFPPRWLLRLPGWARVTLVDLTVWQWLGIAIGAVAGGLIIWLGHRAARHGRQDTIAAHWRALLQPLAIIFVAGALVPFFDTVLRIGGQVRIVIEYARTSALYLSAAWLSVAFSVVLGEAIVGSERLTIRSLDSQLIRLGTRLIGVVAAVSILVEGGDELGFPAYSVLAGLGVGGLAVALAAQSTIANLIGSLLIVLEKPFRVGHKVKIGASEGVVEDVGFRSTRIRTPDNSLVTIPSSAVVNATVENLSVRAKRLQRFVVQVSHEMPREKLEALAAAIRQLLAEHPLVETGTVQVRLYNLGESSLDILVRFYFRVSDSTSELIEREAVLLQIMDLTKDAGVKIAPSEFD
ncbi:MAG: mechanosensitive ion channel family protein, partial [Acetobacteraceae bacterium]|nr:mechanosensitive ion channel family protein [Acetobacteraceae bacterium]